MTPPRVRAALSALVGLLRRRPTSADLAKHIPHGPDLSVEYEERLDASTLPPMGDWPGEPTDPDYIPPAPPKEG